MEERRLSVAETSQRLGVQKETVRKYIGDGRLPAVRLPNEYFRISEQDLERMLEPVEAVGV